MSPCGRSGKALSRRHSIEDKPMCGILQVTRSGALLKQECRLQMAWILHANRGKLSTQRRTLSRPGVATMTCTPLRSAVACVCLGTPPYAHTVVRPARLPASSMTAAICIASSRVGDRISTDGAFAARAGKCLEHGMVA